MTLRRLAREPLLHFVLAGGILFGIFSLTHRGEVAPSDKTIVVDNESLLNFLQYRSKAFKPDYFAAQLQAMSPQERKSIEDEYVEEEMLYREAKALGLEQGDYVIRQRLVQKMRFLIDDLVETGGKPNEAALEEYLIKNKEFYVIEPTVTFTHVFLDSAEHGDTQARDAAERLKVSLNARGIAFNDVSRFGDRFPFLQNYVERTLSYVESHFGNEFVSHLQSLSTSQKRWNGPIPSTYGYHLVLMTHRTETRLPKLDEIRTQVEEDWARDRMEGARSQSMTRLENQYTIERKKPVEEPSNDAMR